MPQVPYTPYPTERLHGTPTPEVRVPTPSAAFGSAVASSVQELGRRTEQIGGEIFARAVEMQQRANETAVDDLSIRASIEAGQLKAKFNSLEGKDAAAALPKYQQDLEDLHQKYSSMAGNPAVQRAFDHDFKRRVGSMIIDGGAYAAGQTKVWQRGVRQAQIDRAVSDAAQSPEDDLRFQQSLGAAKQAARDEAYAGGIPEEADSLERKAVTRVWAGKLTSIAKNDPLRARDLFEKYRGEMDGLEALKLQSSINQSIITVQSRLDSQRIMAGYGALSEDYIGRIKDLEGFAPKAKWDVKQHSNGFGTKAQPGDDSLPPEEFKRVAEMRMRQAAGRAANVVDNVNANLPEGTRAALISLTYNTGDKWVTEGLGKAVAAGDLDKAKEIFGQYNNVDGSPSEAIAKRRMKELSWWGQGETKERGPMTANSAASRVSEAMDEVKSTAERLFPNDPGNQAAYQDMLNTRVKTEFNNLRSTANAVQKQNAVTVWSELVNQDPTKAPKRFEDLSADAQEAFKELGPQEQKKVLGQLNTNSKGGVPATAERTMNFERILGAISKDPTLDRINDIYSADVTVSDRGKLITQLTNLLQKKDSNQGILHAMNVLDTTLRLAKVYSSTKDDPEAIAATQLYNQFMGKMTQELTNYRQAHGKGMDDATVLAVGKQLLARTMVPGRLWGTNEGPFVFQTKDEPLKFSTDEIYQQWPSGTVFIDPRGVKRIKP